MQRTSGTMVLAVLVSFAAAAQEAPAQPTSNPAPQDAAVETGTAGGPSGQRQKAEEEIVVTGSRVRRKDLTTPAPVTNYISGLTAPALMGRA